jgi:hypothetical protein
MSRWFNSSASEKCHCDSWQELPDIPGLNVAEGLSRLGGNAANLVKLLHAFENRYSSFAPSIHKLVDADVTLP